MPINISNKLTNKKYEKTSKEVFMSELRIKFLFAESVQ